MGTAQSGMTTRTPREIVKPLSAVEADALPLVPHSVYALLSEHVYREPNRRPLPPGWTVLTSADEVGLECDGYFSTAYINEQIRHVIVAARGTADANGVRTGIWVYFDVPTVQFALAEEFSKVVRLKLQLELESPPEVRYTVSYAGHSLGAIIATCRACAEGTFAVTFESPGCKSFVEKTMHPFKIEDSDVITYLRPPNPINSLKPHIGYVLQLPWDQDKAPPMPSASLDMTEIKTGTPVPTSSATTSLAISPSAEKAEGDKKSSRWGLPTLPSLSPSTVVASAQNYVTRQVVERAVPEVFQYLGKIEPYIRDLFDHTQQVHSIAGIVKVFEASDNTTTHPRLLFEPEKLETVLLWPTNLLQYFELAYTNRNLEALTQADHRVRSAYTTMQHTLYNTTRRERNEIPLQYLNSDTRRLLGAWAALSDAQRDRLFPSLTPTDWRILHSFKVEGQKVVTVGGISAFQFKQYMAIKVMHYPEVVRYAVQLATASKESKL